MAHSHRRSVNYCLSNTSRDCCLMSNLRVGHHPSKPKPYPRVYVALRDQFQISEKLTTKMLNRTPLIATAMISCHSRNMGHGSPESRSQSEPWARSLLMTWH